MFHPFLLLGKVGLIPRVELTSPTVGIVRRLGADEGVVVKVGELICDIDTGGAGDVEIEQSHETEPIVSETTAPTINEAGSNESALPAESILPQAEQDESLFQSRDTLLDTSSGAQFSGEAAMLPSPPPPPRSTSTATSIHEGTEPPRKEREKWSEIRKIVKASPAVRTLAARMGVELSGVKGTGDGGRVVKEDVVSASSSSLESASTSSSGMGMGTRGVADTKRDEIPMTTRVEFGRTRKVMYRAMGDMGHVPHFG
jgi:2-oxoisovalerate dehydrogenase E2 component (dihydrolipoyl transacylase)